MKSREKLTGRQTIRGKITGNRGRPFGTRKRRRFEETNLGFFLKYEAPIEYELLMESLPKKEYVAPSIKIIEAIAASSPNPVFKKNKFFKYLEEYRVNKLCAKRPKLMTEKRMAYYKRLQETQVKKYLAEMEKRGYRPY